MEAIDRFFLNWIKANGLDLEEYVSYMGWPSEDPIDHPYLEELPHLLNGLESESRKQIPLPLPPEITAYKLSKWTGTQVPLDHPLVRDREKWRISIWNMIWLILLIPSNYIFL